MVNEVRVTNISLYSKNEDDSFARIELFPEARYTEPPDGTIFKVYENVSFSINPDPVRIVLKPFWEKHSRCKNRKRLVKLLMSKGLDRNGANNLAQLVARSDTTFEAFWRNLQFGGFEYLSKFKLRKTDNHPILGFRWE